jgi:hypothetical protein
LRSPRSRRYFDICGKVNDEDWFTVCGKEGAGKYVWVARGLAGLGIAAFGYMFSGGEMGTRGFRRRRFYSEEVGRKKAD